METSLITGFAQIFSSCPKNLSCPKFGGADTSPQSAQITENFTSIQVVIPLWIGAEFPDTVVLWLAERRTVGVEL